MSDKKEAVYIVGAARTPIGAFLGELANLPATTLGSTAIAAALKRADIAASNIDETWMGQVLSAGAGQAPARQAAKGAGISDSTPAATVNKVCGSGLQAIISGAKSIMLSDAQVVVAGGMESMSNTPFLLDKARSGLRLGNAALIDGVVHDGLWDPYNNFHMGNAAEICAKEYHFTREAQDAFAIESYRRAQEAQAAGHFNNEIAPVTLATKGKEEVIAKDEEPGRSKPEKMPTLKPAFDKAGTITAANASKLNDGAAAVVLASESALKAHNLKPLARIVSYAGHAQAPEWFTTAPVKATHNALARAGLKASDIDLYEINEAFSVVTMACTKDVGIDPAKVNVWGGAVALGHPIGASGCRIVVTLLHALAQRNAKRGLATLCIGGGEALALIIERI